MWERFNERARRVIVMAQEEASRLGHSYVGTGHVLIGLVSDNIVAQALADGGVDLAKLHETIEAELNRL